MASGDRVWISLLNSQQVLRPTGRHRQRRAVSATGRGCASRRPARRPVSRVTDAGTGRVLSPTGQRVPVGRRPRGRRAPAPLTTTTVEAAGVAPLRSGHAQRGRYRPISAVRGALNRQRGRPLADTRPWAIYAARLAALHERIMRRLTVGLWTGCLVRGHARPAAGYAPRLGGGRVATPAASVRATPTQPRRRGIVGHAAAWRRARPRIEPCPALETPWWSPHSPREPSLLVLHPRVLAANGAGASARPPGRAVRAASAAAPGLGAGGTERVSGRAAPGVGGTLGLGWGSWGHAPRPLEAPTVWRGWACP